jgi:Sigma-70, region 4
MPFERTEAQAHIDTQALRLRSLGYTYRRIAEEMGCNVGTAYSRVQRALAQIPAEAVDEYRSIQRQQMDDLMATYLPQALAGDYKSAELVMKLLDRRAKLEGIDAPAKHEVITIDYIDAEIRRLETVLGEQDDHTSATAPDGTA